MEDGSSSVSTLTLAEAREFVNEVPWRDVQMRPEGPANKPPDPHQYVIATWSEVPREACYRFANLIRLEGYKGRYSPPYDPGRVMVSDYLELDGYIYWFVEPQMLNRQRAEHRQHEVIQEQEQLI